MRFQYVRDRIRSLFALKDPPHRLALAFAVGIFIAFNPLVGLHTLMALGAVWAFRLNAVVLFAAAFTNNPWTVVPMYGFCLWFGIRLTGGSRAVPDIPWGDAGIRDILLFLQPYVWPFVIGTLVVGTVASLASYGLFYWALMRYRKGASG